MAPVILPKPTRETDIEIRELSWSKDMIPSTSGPSQRQARIGTKHAITFSIPVLRYAWCGAGLAADLAVGRTGDGAVMAIPEPNIPVYDYGTPRVNGALQLGDVINLDGLTPGTTIKKGKWLTLTANGRYYAYFSRADVLVPIGGAIALPIYPMIRRSAADNSLVLLAAPVIQGLIKEPLRRKILRIGGIGLDFEIEEQE